MIALSPSPFEQFASNNQYDITPAVLSAVPSNIVPRPLRNHSGQKQSRG